MSVEAGAIDFLALLGGSDSCGERNMAISYQAAKGCIGVILS